MRHSLVVGARLGLSGLFVAITLAACTLGPDFKRPDTPATPAYSQSIHPTGSAISLHYGDDIAEDWYRLFHSDALNSLIRETLENNPELEAARHGLVAAQWELKAVSGSSLPQIDASGQVGRARINGSELYGPVNELEATGNRFALGPALTYNLDAFGGVRRTIEAQRAAASVVREQTLNTYVTLVNQVVITAFDYAAVREQIEVTQALLTQLQAQVELTQKLENAGKITRSDTLQAQTQFENVAATLPGLEQQRDVYRNALAQLSGRTPDEFQMPNISLKDFVLPSELPVSVPSILVRHRPDILAAEETLHQASANIGVAEAARFPALSLSAQYAQQTTKINEFLTHPGGIWSAGLDFTAPLFHGGTLTAREREAKEQYLQAKATYRSTIITAFVEVANALRSLEHDTDSYLAHRRALDTARANLDLTTAQYRAGRYTELQVLTAEQQYQQAALSQVAADVQRFTDVATLFRALGGGWWNAQHDPTVLPSADFVFSNNNTAPTPAL